MLFFIVFQRYKYRAAEAHRRNVESPYNPANAIGGPTIRSHRPHRLLTEFLFFLTILVFGILCLWYNS
jgi:hypothetical protein